MKLFNVCITEVINNYICIEAKTLKEAKKIINNLEDLYCFESEVVNDSEPIITECNLEGMKLLTVYGLVDDEFTELRQYSTDGKTKTIIWENNNEL